MTALLLLAAGAASFGVVSRYAVPPLAWIALPLLLHATRSMRGVTGMAGAFAAISVALAITKRDTMPMPMSVYAGIIAVETSLVVAALTIDRVAAVRPGSVAATLVFPVALTAVEFLRSRYTPAASWGSIAYSQYGALPIMQLASVTGIWGITFLLGWFGSAAEFAWRLGLRSTPGAIACAITIALVAAAGSLRVALAPTDRHATRVATLNRPLDLFAPGEITRISEGRVSPAERDAVRTKLSRLHDWFLDGSRRESRAGARLVAWPEQSLLVLSGDEASFLERAARVAADARVYLAMGMAAIHLGDPHPFENKLVIVDPEGRVIATYRKVHPVPGWEAGIMQAGRDPIPVVATSAGRLAATICFDADFPDFVRTAGRQDADAIVVVANDWKAIDSLHLQMHAFRAIENGAPLVRAAASGLSAAFDPWGRVLGVASFFGGSDGTMIAQVPIAHVATLYARLGDWLGWLSVMGTLFSIIFRIVCMTGS